MALWKSDVRGHGDGEWEDLVAVTLSRMKDINEKVTRRRCVTSIRSRSHKDSLLPRSPFVQ